MSFDIGSPAIDRASNLGANNTMIAKENPASQDGTIEHVAIYTPTPGAGLEVAIFRNVGVNLFTTRSRHTIGAYPLGYSEYDVNLDCKTGDYIGCYFTGGQIDRENVGEGYWVAVGDHIPCTAKNFTFYSPRTISLWGWYTTPPIAYRNWRITDIQYTQNCHTLTVKIKTDVNCHLWLRFTKHKPHKHPLSSEVRGIIMPYDLRTCFVVYDDLEQEEAGDTDEHTFIITDIAFCTHRYFYFWGQSAATTMVNTSAIFGVFYPLGTPPFKTCDSSEDIGTAFHYCQEWNAASQIFTPTHDHTITDISLCLNQAHLDRRGGYCVKLTQVGGPCWAETLLDYVTGGSPGLPVPNSKIWRIFRGFHQFVFKDVQYRIVVHTLPHWECWNGEEWLPCETFAALQWWLSPPTNPYPRGAHWAGCNFLTGSGSWSEYPDYDATFINWQRCPSKPS